MLFNSYLTQILFWMPTCFLVSPSAHNMVKDITVVETNYTDYALVVKHRVFNREYTQVALYGKRHTHAQTEFIFNLSSVLFISVLLVHICPCTYLQVALKESRMTWFRSLKPLLCPWVFPESLFWPHLQQVNLHIYPRYSGHILYNDVKSPNSVLCVYLANRKLPPSRIWTVGESVPLWICQNQGSKL